MDFLPSQLCFRLLIGVIIRLLILVISGSGGFRQLPEANLTGCRNGLLALGVLFDIGILSIKELGLGTLNLLVKHIGLAVIDATHCVLSILIDQLIVTGQSAGLTILDLHNRADIVLERRSGDVLIAVRRANAHLVQSDAKLQGDSGSVSVLHLHVANGTGKHAIKVLF